VTVQLDGAVVFADIELEHHDFSAHGQLGDAQAALFGLTCLAGGQFDHHVVQGEEASVFDDEVVVDEVRRHAGARLEREIALSQLAGTKDGARSEL
jgi:hypothetical protein